MREGFVYLIRSMANGGGYGAVKIGFTCGHPSKRLASLQTGSADVLYLAAFWPGTEVEEKLLHITFAPLQIHREWFFLRGKLLDFLSHMETHKVDHKQPQPRERFEDAVSECILATDPDHPAVDVQDWLASADTSPWGRWQ